MLRKSLLHLFFRLLSRNRYLFLGSDCAEKSAQCTGIVALYICTTAVAIYTMGMTERTKAHSVLEQ